MELAPSRAAPHGNVYIRSHWRRGRLVSIETVHAEASPMARMHTRRKGQSGSKRPSALRVPEWLDKDAEWVEKKVI
ncbi:MAG: hypothetical protein ACTSVD_05530, partial [Candidatus Thorarchaeota archaeon]